MALKKEKEGWHVRMKERMGQAAFKIFVFILKAFGLELGDYYSHPGETG